MVTIKSKSAMTQLHKFITQMAAEGWYVDLFLNEEQPYAKTESIRIEVKRDVDANEERLAEEIYAKAQEHWQRVVNEINEQMRQQREQKDESTEGQEATSTDTEVATPTQVETPTDGELSDVQEDAAQPQQEEGNSKL